MVALDEFCANAVVVPTILPVILGRMVALAALALVGCLIWVESYVVALATLALVG